LYAQFRLEEAWDGPHNQSLLARMPKVFAPPPVDDLEVEPYTTFYQAIVGGGTAFEGGKELKLSDFRDGTANTLLVVEARQAVPWTKPADVPYAVNRPVPQLGGIFHSKGRFSLFGANRQVGFGAVFADGSVRFLRADLPEATLRGLITRNGGEKLGDDW
ncbi:MAG TPA: hypothetical protein VG013_12790, partial [Gemmataceae bacterium]|nr:hypothetical protein [Gemmataceae bacterium]